MRSPQNPVVPTASTPATLASAPSRRSFLRAAAWSVPAVTLVTAAPAYASSTVTDGPTGGTFATLALGTAEWDVLATPTHLDVENLAVRTTETSRPVPARALTAHVTFPHHFVRYLGFDAEVVISRVSEGWEATAPVYRGSRRGRHAVVTFTHVDPVQPGWRAGTRPLSFRARMAGPVIQPSLNRTPLPVVVRAPGFAAAPGLIAVR